MDNLSIYLLIIEKYSEIHQWQEVCDAFSKKNDTITEIIQKRIGILRSDLKRSLNSSQIDANVYQTTLIELTEKVIFILFDLIFHDHENSL